MKFTNYIIIVLKHEIYKSRWTKKMINLTTLLQTLKAYLIIEEYISAITDCRGKTLGKWSPIYNVLKRLKQ